MSVKQPNTNTLPAFRREKPTIKSFPVIPVLKLRRAMKANGMGFYEFSELLFIVSAYLYYKRSISYYSIMCYFGIDENGKGLQVVKNRCTKLRDLGFITIDTSEFRSKILPTAKALELFGSYVSPVKGKR